MAESSRSGMDSLSPVPRAAAPLRHQVLEALRESIVKGRLAPGDRLRERELIDRMGVSRTVIREVLRQLEAQGLIDVMPNKGAVVRKLTAAEANELYAIRGVLEGLAARLFTQNADEDELKALCEELEETAKAYAEADPDTILRTKNKFYDRLFRGARSNTLSEMIETLHDRIWRWRALGLAHPNRSRGRSVESVNSLRALVDAISARDSARAEMIAREEVNKAAIEIMRILEIEDASE